MQEEKPPVKDNNNSDEPQIPTISEKLEKSSLQNSKFCFGAESFMHNNGDESEGELPLDLQNMHKILKNPKLSRTNLVLNQPHKIASSLAPLLSATHPEAPFFFVDCTRVEKSRDLEKLKKMELGGKIKAGYCYLPQYSYVTDKSSLEEVKLVLQEKRVFKKIEHEAFDGPLCFTGLGVLFIKNLMTENHFEALMWPGLARFCSVHDSPILIDLEGRDRDGEVLKWLLGAVEERIRRKVVLLNLGVSVKREEDFDAEKLAVRSITTADSFGNFAELVGMGFSVQFPILRFLRIGLSSRSVAKILELAHLTCESNQPGSSSRLLATTGIDYKTDFLEFGGPGLEPINEVYNELKLENQAKLGLFRDNCLELFSWWRPKKLTKEDVRLTKCYICGTEGRDVSKWFSKDGLFFATPQCFKKYLKSTRK